MPENRSIETWTSESWPERYRIENRIGRLSIEHMFRLVSVSRRGFYRSLQEQQPAEEERDGGAIGDPTDCPGASSPLRLSAHHGGAAPPRMQINHKRVAQIMREDTAGRIPQSRVSALHASGSALILI
jgi:hypothetical protein